VEQTARSHLVVVPQLLTTDDHDLVVVALQTVESRGNSERAHHAGLLQHFVFGKRCFIRLGPLIAGALRGVVRTDVFPAHCVGVQHL
jgi:hypothetical protein